MALALASSMFFSFLGGIYYGDETPCCDSISTGIPVDTISSDKLKGVPIYFVKTGHPRDGLDLVAYGERDTLFSWNNPRFPPSTDIEEPEKKGTEILRFCLVTSEQYQLYIDKKISSEQLERLRVIDMPVEKTDLGYYWPYVLIYEGSLWNPAMHLPAQELKPVPTL